MNKIKSFELELKVDLQFKRADDNDQSIFPLKREKDLEWGTQIRSQVMKDRTGGRLGIRLGLKQFWLFIFYSLAKFDQSFLISLPVLVKNDLIFRRNELPGL